MPTYEYRCPDGHEFEKFQRMTDPPGAECPECGGDAERILSGGAGFLFKGEGFYITDYRSDSYKKAARKEEGGSTDTSGEKSADSRGGGGSDTASGSGGGASKGGGDAKRSGEGSGA